MEQLAVQEDIFFVILYGGAILLEAVAALYLLLRRGNAFALEVTSPVQLRRWAAAFLAGASLSHVMWAVYVSHPSQAGYLLACFLDTFLLLPPLAGVLLGMLQDRHRPLWPVIVALLPVIAFFAVAVVREQVDWVVPARIYILSLYVLFTVYMVFAVRRYGRWLRDNYADLEHKEIWKSLLLLAVFLLFFLVYGSSDDGGRIYRYFIQVNNIVIVALLLWRVETLQQLNENAADVAEPAEDVQKTSAQPAIPSNIGPLLEKRCVEGQLYLQHDLTLAQLAQVIGTNRYYLSQHFAQQGLTYNAYINGLRIRHFVHLYHEAVGNQRIFTALQLAHESGFHSYSTFGTAFKQNMGKTVTEWMKNPDN